MRIRRLTEDGIMEFEFFLDSLTTPYPIDEPKSLLSSADTSEMIPPKIEVAKRDFNNRLELAQYLFECFEGRELRDLDQDVSIWSWLSLYYFEQLCPFDEKSGRYKPGERARWIPAVGNWQKYYRHLLAGPYRIYKAFQPNPEIAMVVLSGSVKTHGELAEQILGRSELIQNKAAMEAATSLYIDAGTKKPKKGAASKGPGTARRYGPVLAQFDRTWDLYAMESSDIIKLLPEEFALFKP